MRTRPLLRIMSAIQEYPWAISEDGMATIQAILDRAMTGTEVDLEAVAARLGKPLENTHGRVEMRGSIAVLDVEGPLFRRADLFAEISGATTVQNLAVDLRKAADNPLITHIVLNIDSPGGQVNGIQEFADQVREVATIKPVLAYVDGMAASGAYWIASAASRIIVNDSSLVGSIGVVASVRDNRAAQERQGVKQIEIVSTKSPYKRPDAATEAGRAQILEVIDALAEVFIGRVAAFRGITADQVVAKYGQGKILPAPQALAAGMADEITSFEPLLSRLAEEKSVRPIPLPSAARAAKETPMADTTPRNDPPPAAPPAPPAAQPPNPAPAAAAIPAAPPAAPAAPVAPSAPVALTDRQRIAAILNCEEAKGREEQARILALETDLDVATCRNILKSAPPPAAAKGTGFEAAMQRAANPTVGVGTGEGDTPAAEAASVLRFVPKNRRVQAS